jgi:uncharacterized protein
MHHSFKGLLVLLAKLAMLVAASGTAHAVTFDCNKARLPDEVVICSESDLSKLDDQVNQTYLFANAQQPQGQRDYLKLRQRQWLNVRHRCNADKACIRKVMQDNMAWLANPHLAYEGTYVKANKLHFLRVTSFAAGHMSIMVGGNTDGAWITPDEAKPAGKQAKITDNSYTGAADEHACIPTVKFDGAMAQVSITPPKGKKLKDCLSSKDYVGTYKRDYAKVE